jgi:hypothetical protein
MATTLPHPLRLGTRARRVVTGLGFAVPAAVYAWFVHAYTLNAVYWDQWRDVSLIEASYDGRLSFATLWAQHNENRMLFPNLLVLAMSRLDSFNVSFEEYLSALLLLASVALIIRTHQRRSPDRPLLAYCPVAILMLSAVQAQNTLWGFQFAWYLVLVTLCGALCLLDRRALTWPALTAAAILAIVGSFSSLQGLLIWIAGLILLLYRSRRPVMIILWTALAVVTSLVYFHDYQGTPSYASPEHVPGRAILFFFESIGDVIGVPLTTTGVGASAVAAFGGAIVVLALYCVWSSGRRRDSEGGAPLGIALVVVGLAFALMTTYGRAVGGPQAASASRYTTFDLLIPVGAYLIYIGDLRGSRNSVLPHGASRVVGVLLGVVIALVAVMGLVNGVRWARAYNQDLSFDAVIMADGNRIPGPILPKQLYAAESESQLRQGIDLLATRKLTFFADPETVRGYRRQAAILTRAGVFRSTPPPPLAPTQIVVPKTDSVLQGRVLLAATAAPDLDPIKVTFALTGDGGGQQIVAKGRKTPLGWVAFWRTTDHQNGSFALTSVVTSAAGVVTQSQPISITIRNKVVPAG